MSDLKPCPDLRCGCNDASACFTEGGNFTGWHIHCGACSFSGTTFKNLSDAVYDWNNRPHENQLKADAVREAAYHVVSVDVGYGVKHKSSRDALCEYADRLEMEGNYDLPHKTRTVRRND